jgi:hypothetical protein
MAGIRTQLIATMTALAVFAASLSCVCAASTVATIAPADAMPLHACCQVKRDNGKPTPAKDENCNRCREDRIAQSSPAKSPSLDPASCHLVVFLNAACCTPRTLRISRDATDIPSNNYKSPTLLGLHCALNC